MEAAIAIVSIVLLIAGVFIWRIVSREFGRIAGEKGYPARPYARYTFWLGLVGMLMVIALPDRKGAPAPMASAADAPAQEQAPSAVPAAPARSVVNAATELGNQASHAAQAIMDFARSRVPSPAEQQADAGSKPPRRPEKTLPAAEAGQNHCPGHMEVHLRRGQSALRAQVRSMPRMALHLQRNESALKGVL